MELVRRTSTEGVRSPRPDSENLGLRANAHRIKTASLTTTTDGLLDSFGRMFRQEFEDTDVRSSAGVRSFTLLEDRSQLRDRRWQLPVAIDLRVIQESRLGRQIHEIM